MKSSSLFGLCEHLVLLSGPGDGLVLGLARVPQEEGDAERGQGHHGKGGPVQLKRKKDFKSGSSSQVDNNI